LQRHGRGREKAREREREGEHLLIARAAVVVIIAVVVGFYVVLLVFYFISPQHCSHSHSASLALSAGPSGEAMWRSSCDEEFSAPSWPVYR